MIFKVGQNVKRRDGAVVTIQEIATPPECGSYPIRAGDHWYYPDGRNCGGILQWDLMQILDSTGFDWDAFQVQLAKSTAICAKGKADIKAAVAAGQGKTPEEKSPIPVLGQIWRQGRNTVFMLQSSGSGTYVAACLGGGTDGCHIGGTSGSLSELVGRTDAKYVAKNLAEYLAAGGKL